MRFLFRIFVFICLLVALKGFVQTEPAVYISLPETETVFNRIQWEVQRIQRVAQDLPASLEMVLRQIFDDAKVMTEAKVV